MSLKPRLPQNEWRDLQTMIGQVFAVTEIDEYGQPWVEKWWKNADGSSYCHSLALESDEMKVVTAAATRPKRGVSHRPSRPSTKPARQKRPKVQQVRKRRTTTR